MNLHFITSISKEYWEQTAKYCITSWKLPGSVTVFVDQTKGDLDWLSEIPFHKELLGTPSLTFDEFTANSKIQKFWGKSYAQFTAFENIKENERLIWLDADVQQLKPIDETLFNFKFAEPVALMNSGDIPDCWESGLIIFNQEHGKLDKFIKRYRTIWTSWNLLSTLWKPYDAQVIGRAGLERGFYNLCDQPCKNVDAFDNTRYSKYFKHWINKENKEKLKNEKSSDLS